MLLLLLRSLRVRLLLLQLLLLQLLRLRLLLLILLLLRLRAWCHRSSRKGGVGHSLGARRGDAL